MVQYVSLVEACDSQRMFGLLYHYRVIFYTKALIYWFA